MEERYGVPFNREEILQGKKEALLKTVEGKESTPTEKALKTLIDNYRQALGPTSDDDNRVAVFRRLIIEYTKHIISDCLQAFAEAQVEAAFGEDLEDGGNS